MVLLVVLERCRLSEAGPTPVPMKESVQSVKRLNVFSGLYLMGVISSTQ